MSIALSTHWACDGRGCPIEMVYHQPLPKFPAQVTATIDSMPPGWKIIEGAVLCPKHASQSRIVKPTPEMGKIINDVVNHAQRKE